MKRWVYRISMVLLLSCFFLWLWSCSAESSAHWTPDYPMEELSAILQEKDLSCADYTLLYRQTGLSRSAVDSLRGQGKTAQIPKIQQAFFTIPTILCEKNSPISREEHVVEKGEYSASCPIAALENGDILVTPNSHTFGWRNGHAALVVDAENRLTLESAVLGDVSGIQSVDKWESFPAYMVLRVSSLSPEERGLTAVYAMEELLEIPYGFTVGLFSPKYPEAPLQETHCAHLIWAAYMRMGVDLDADGGSIVTPKQLAASPLLEVVQVTGIDPQELWK